MESEKKRRILKLLNSIKSRNPSLDNLQANLHQMNSYVETTIWCYPPSRDTVDANIPLIKGSDGNYYPKYPVNDYASRYTNVFNDCLEYVSLNHLYKIYPDKDNSEKKRKISRPFGSCAFHWKDRNIFRSQRYLKPLPKNSPILSHSNTLFTSNPSKPRGKSTLLPYFRTCK